jgi:hypothetical protein
LQRERKRLAAGFPFDQLLRLLLRVEVMFQPPAFQPRATVREHGDHVGRLDTDIAFAGVADDRRCG